MTDDVRALTEQALLEACLALETIARRVYNDNGDHTIDTSPLHPDVYSACYYASRTVKNALRARSTQTPAPKEGDEQR